MTNDSNEGLWVVEQATFTPTALPGVDFMLPACDLCGAYVARREVHEQWHRQFTHVVDEPSMGPGWGSEWGAGS